MPWTDNSGNSGNGGGRGPTRGPWGQQPRGGGGGGGPKGGGEPPDLEELLQASRQRLKRAFPQRGGRGAGGGGGGGPQIEMTPRVFALIGGALLLLWAFAGTYQIGPGGQGVTTTFGKYTGIAGSGLHWRAPFFQHVYKVGVEDQRITAIGGSSGSDSENLMLTSDRNIVSIGFSVYWKIKSEPPAEGQMPNAAKYIFNIGEDQAEALVRGVAESAMRETIGAQQLVPIITSGQAAVSSQTLARIQEVLDSYNTGIEVIGVRLERAEVPSAVRDAFADVIKAGNEKAQMINDAQRISNQIVPVAEGDGQKMVEEARAYAAKVESEAIGEADRFNRVFEEYRVAKQVTKQRMYLETMEQVLGPMNKIMIDDEAGKGVVPYLPLNEISRPKTEPQQQQ